LTVLELSDWVDMLLVLKISHFKICSTEKVTTSSYRTLTVCLFSLFSPLALCKDALEKSRVNKPDDRTGSFLYGSTSALRNLYFKWEVHRLVSLKYFMTVTINLEEWAKRNWDDPKQVYVELEMTIIQH